MNILNVSVITSLSLLQGSNNRVFKLGNFYEHFVERLIKMRSKHCIENETKSKKLKIKNKETKSTKPYASFNVRNRTKH